MLWNKDDLKILTFDSGSNIMKFDEICTLSMYFNFASLMSNNVFILRWSTYQS